MSAITVNGLNINDQVSYLVEEITFRNVPERSVSAMPLAKRPGAKLTSTEWQTKDITIRGHVFSDTPGGLRTLIDTLQQNFAVPSATIFIDTDRSYTATLKSLEIPNQFFTGSYATYTAAFLAVDPFAYGTAVTASGTTTSGTVTVSGTVTISGTVFAGPTLTITPKGANAGNSGIREMRFTHVPTNETVTVSGTFNYNADVIIDFRNYLVTNSGVTSDYTGIFSRFDPGAVSYEITVSSGVANGFNYKWSYQPRYYQ